MTHAPFRLRATSVTLVVLLTGATSAGAEGGHAGTVIHSLTEVWSIEGDQNAASLGASTSTAGDVNGDGYSDVIVGAWQYDNDLTDEGRAYLFLGSATGPTTTPAWTAEGNQTSAHFGKSVSYAGDVNGDGFGDVLVGAPEYDNGDVDEGRAFLYLGSAAGLDTIPAWIGEPNQTGAGFGTVVAGAGDVNADGFDDVLIGSPAFDNGQIDEGRAAVFLGSATGLGIVAVWTTESNQNGGNTGFSVAAAGDVNADGFADVIVGSPLVDSGLSDQGRASVFLGRVDGLFNNPVWIVEANQADAHYGSAVTGLGDVNGDGYGDILVGAPTFDNGTVDEGRAFLYLGSSGGPSTTSTWFSEGLLAGTQWASAVGPAGDVNGDGFADIVIGSYLASGMFSAGGRASAFLGSDTGVSTTAFFIDFGGQIGAGFGRSVGCAGDVNGDGFSDLLIGAGGFDHDQTDEGAAFLYTGAADPPDSIASWSLEGEQIGAEYGFRTIGVGDVNGDGFGDVVVTAHLYSNGQPGEGRATLYLGSRSGLGTTAAWQTEANQDSAEWGTAASPAGDVNGDGFADFVIGTRTWDGAFVDEGRVTLYAGSATGVSTVPSWDVTGGQAGACAGVSAAGAGDVNGDGYADVIAGSYLYDAGGMLDAGRAEVYLGSATGVATTPAWTRYGAQDSANFGFKVASAGDVNADGFSDVIVGAWLMNDPVPDQGEAYLYLGSATGLDTIPAWTAKGETPKSQFAVWVSTAGDVNGDGYSDVVIGANRFNGPGDNAGRAYVYLGGPSGLGLDPVWTFTGSPEDFLGTVATAGDVNNDGYSDIMVAAPMFGNGQTEEGIVTVFFGSPEGPRPTADWTYESNHAFARIGEGASSAGDVNGDGFGDIIIGSNDYSNPLKNEGAAYLFFGNASDGTVRQPRQMRVGTSRSVVALGLSDQNMSYRLTATGRSPSGRTNVAMEFESAAVGVPLDGSHAVVGTFLDTGLPNGQEGSTVPLSEIVDGLAPNTLAHWRMRVVTRSPIFPRSPWMWLPSNAATESDIRTPLTSDARIPGTPPRPAARFTLDVRPSVSDGDVTITCRGAGTQGPARVQIHHVSGTLVRTLDGSPLLAGAPSLRWDGRDASGHVVPSGVYVIRVVVGSASDSRRVVVRR